MEKYILAIDAGTTSSRAIIFDRKGTTIGLAQHEFTQFFPKESWVEHDGIEIWETQLKAIHEVLENSNIKAEQIQAMGITNQRETTLIWDRKTGKPVHNAIVWQDRRTSDICEKLKKEGTEKQFYKKTGLILDAYFSGTKIKWILDQDPKIRHAAEQGELAFGTVDSWLIWNLTKGQVHVTDVTNASRTLLFNIHTLEWDEELLNTLGVPKALLPKVVSCSENVGQTHSSFFEHSIPIAGIAGDQQAALFGQMCISPGDVKNTYGTGSIIGITRGTQKGHIARAALEAIALRVKEIVVEMQKDADTTFRSLKVDGGASNNNLLMQTQADLLETDVIRPQTTETTAIGAAFFAGLASGYWESIESLADIWSIDQKFSPAPDASTEKTIDLWNQRIGKLSNQSISNE